MNISSQSLHFTKVSDEHELVLQNNTAAVLIFKLKITKPSIFLIKPPKGILKYSEKVIVHIGIKKMFESEEKLLVSYAEIEDMTHHNYDESWKNIDKSAINNEYIVISCLNDKNSPKNIKNSVKLKQTQSPLLGAEQEKSEKSESNGINLMKLQNSKKNHLNHNTVYQTVSDLTNFHTVTFSSKLVQSREIKRQLHQERQQNKRLRGQLHYYRNIAQNSINKGSQQSEDQGCFTFFNLILLMFIFLFVGFFMAKFNFNFKQTSL